MYQLFSPSEENVQSATTCQTLGNDIQAIQRFVETPPCYSIILPETLPLIRESTLGRVDSEAHTNKVSRGPDLGTVDSGLGGFKEYHRIRLIIDTWCSHDALRNYLYYDSKHASNVHKVIRCGSVNVWKVNYERVIG